MPANMHSDRDVVTHKVAYTLYLCHLLSTWNAKMYEFAVVIFTAAAYPKDLTASSIFGIVMSLSILLFASLLGTWVDRGQSRLTTLITTISANRISVIAACVCWFFIVGLEDLGSHSSGAEAVSSTAEESPMKPRGLFLGLKNLLFALVLFLSVVERLSRTANLFSIERDWVPVIATPELPAENDGPSPDFGLVELNAAMSRIDLVCKLLSPIVMSAFISAVGSVEIGVLALLILNGSTWAAEIWSARSVWKSSNRLQALKVSGNEGDRASAAFENSNVPAELSNEPITNPPGPWWQRSSRRIYGAFQTARGGISIWFEDYADNLHIYFNHSVWLPSMALSILHFSVLNYSATLSTYLTQSAGFSWNLITVAKALSAVAELGSTFITPWVVRQTGKMLARRKNAMSTSGMATTIDSEDRQRLLPEQRHDENDDDEEDGRRETVEGEGEETLSTQTDMGVAVVGFWSLIQMVISLIPACLALWALSPPSTLNTSTTTTRFITLTLLTTIPLSRIGRWTNHLATQQLTQTLVPDIQRSAFAGAEASFVSLFNLGHWVVTAIWSGHGQFRYLALGSVVSVAASVAIYWAWLRRVELEGGSGNDSSSAKVRGRGRGAVGGGGD